MKEIQLLNSNDHQHLLQQVEKSTGLVLPVNDDRLGPISFHLYAYQEHPGVHFQMRWGVRTIFHKKNLPAADKDEMLNKLNRLIQRNAGLIKENLTVYCLEQLNNIVFLELDPHLSAVPDGGHQLTLEVCKARRKAKTVDTGGWPNYCVAISWFDESGEFQEFLYPLRIDRAQKMFLIPAGEIASRFRAYRDQLI